MIPGNVLDMGCVFNFFLLSCQFFFLAAWKPEPVRPKVGYSGQLSLGFAGGQMTNYMLLPLPAPVNAYSAIWAVSLNSPSTQREFCAKFSCLSAW